MINNGTKIPFTGLSSQSTSGPSKAAPKSSFMARIKSITNSIKLPETLAVAGTVLVVAGVGLAFVAASVAVPLLVLGGIVLIAMGAVVYGTKPAKPEKPEKHEKHENNQSKKETSPTKSPYYPPDPPSYTECTTPSPSEPQNKKVKLNF